jgi:hypothetical protein
VAEKGYQKNSWVLLVIIGVRKGPLFFFTDLGDSFPLEKIGDLRTTGLGLLVLTRPNVDALANNEATIRLSSTSDSLDLFQEVLSECVRQYLTYL